VNDAGPAARDSASERDKQSLRLWLRLLACENIVEQQIRARLRERFGITLPQFDVMAALEHVEEPLTMTELSKRLMVSNGNVTGVVDRLVREGYVRRVPSRRDRRVQQIALTDSGMAEFRKIARCHEQWVSESFSGIPLKDVNMLTSLLSTTQERLRGSSDKR
jgi:DNA-binding MarR family transcriptional regulator